MRRAPGSERVRFESQEGLHLTTVKPTSEIHGEGAVESLGGEAGIDLRAPRSNKAILQNGLNPSAVALMEEGSKVDVGRRVTEQDKRAHAGS